MENILELFMFSWSWLVPPACTGYYGSSCFSSRIWEIKENKSTWYLGNFILFYQHLQQTDYQLLLHTARHCNPRIETTFNLSHLLSAAR